jgi:hypothetical protein
MILLTQKSQRPLAMFAYLTPIRWTSPPAGERRGMSPPAYTFDH